MHVRSHESMAGFLMMQLYMEAAAATFSLLSSGLAISGAEFATSAAFFISFSSALLEKILLLLSTSGLLVLGRKCRDGE